MSQRASEQNVHQRSPASASANTVTSDKASGVAGVQATQVTDGRAPVAGMRAAILSLQRSAGNRVTSRLVTAGASSAAGPAPRVTPSLFVAAAADRTETDADRMAALAIGNLGRRARREGDAGDGSSDRRRGIRPAGGRETADAEDAASGRHARAELTAPSSPPTSFPSALDTRTVAVGPLLRQSRSGVGAEGGVLDDVTAASIMRARAGGKPLDNLVRRSFEDAFGTDFSAVRVHDDHDAHALNDQVNARAFTVGNDIFLGRPGYSATTTGGRELLAHELSHVVQQAVAPAGPAPVVRRNYAGLTSMGQKRVDQEVEQTYQRRALDFELGMARLVEADGQVNATADYLVSLVRQIVDAWATHTGRGKAETYEREFSFAGGEGYYGAFEMTADNINTVLVDALHQPLRKKLKLIYNAVRNNNMAKWLKLASIELDRAARGKAPKDWNIRTQATRVERPRGKPGRLRAETLDQTVTSGFARDSGLAAKLTAPQVTSVAGAAAGERQTAWSGMFNTTRRDVFDEEKFGTVLGWKPETVKANQERTSGVSSGLKLNEQRTLTVADVPDLTSAETDLILKRQGNLSPDPTARAAYKATGANRVPWTQGGESFDIKLGSDSARAADQVKARLEAGISGSTDLMMHAAEYLGVQPGSSVAKGLRLGLAGWMIANRDHSFYEVYKAAVPYGLPFTVDPAHPGSEYEVADHLYPMQRADFIGVLPNDGPLNNPFPADYFSVAYKDQVANALANPADTQPQIKTALEAVGLSSTTLSTMDERDTAALQKLDGVAQGQPINAGDKPAVKGHAVRQIRLHPSFIHLGNVYGKERAEGILNALIRHHHPGAGASHDDTRTRLEELGVPRAVLLDNAEVLRIDAVRQAIVAAPLGAAGAAMALIDAATNNVTLAEKDAIKWNLIGKLRPAWGALGAGEQALSDMLERRAQLEQIADMQRTTGVWYSWGDVGMLRGYIGAASLREATRGVPSTQGPGLYIGRDVTTSAGYGDQAGQRCLVIKLADVPTISSLNEAQKAKLRLLQPRKNTPDVLDAAYLYDQEVSVEIMMIYGGGRFARLTTNKGVKLSTNLKDAPVDHLRAQYNLGAGKWPGQSRQNLLAQCAQSGIDTSAW